jgi:hypothetical protein
MDALLMELCVTHGWCLEPADHEALLAVDARDSDVITDEIIRAEMGEDYVVDGPTRDWLKALVDDWLVDPHGRGASLGPPRSRRHPRAIP